MKEIHFYSNKIKSLIILIISVGFCLLFIQSYDKLENQILYKVIILHFGFLLFLFSSIYSILLLLRRKPLLSITNSGIIIHNLLRKPVSVKFEEISKFSVSDTRYRGLKTTEYIHIVLKYPENASHKKFPIYSNAQNVIQSDILNIKTSKLLEILNKKLSSFHSQENFD